MFPQVLDCKNVTHSMCCQLLLRVGLMCQHSFTLFHEVHVRQLGMVYWIYPNGLAHRQATQAQSMTRTIGFNPIHRPLDRCGPFSGPTSQVNDPVHRVRSDPSSFRLSRPIQMAKSSPRPIATIPLSAIYDLASAPARLLWPQWRSPKN